MIRASNLSKSFGSLLAVKDVNLEIPKGEFYGLLGPNGAGKTTTINILSTLLHPDSGQVIINGTDIYKDPSRAKRSMGVVPQEIALYEDLSAYDNLIFWGKLSSILKKEWVLP